MELEERIPGLSDSELKNLHDNAVRLLQSGTPAQKSNAERLIPFTEAALEERRIARAASQKLKRETTKAEKKKPARARAELAS